MAKNQRDPDRPAIRDGPDHENKSRCVIASLGFRLVKVDEHGRGQRGPDVSILRSYGKSLKITYDPAKRQRALDDRGLDFADAIEVFAGRTLNFPDRRFDYGETRILTVGRLRGRMVIVVWTPRGDTRHVISMRKANGREQAQFGQRLGES